MSWRTRRLAGEVLRALVSVSLVAWLLHRIGLGAMVAAISSADPRWLVAAFVVMLTSNVVGSYQWGRLLKLAGVELGPARVLDFYLVGIFFNNFLPSTIGGDVSRIVDAGRESGRQAAVIGATLVDRFLGMSVIALLAVAASLALRGQLTVAGDPRPIVVGLAFMASASVGGLGLLLSRRASVATARLAARLPRPICEPLTRLVEALAPVRAARGLALALLLVSLIVQVMRISTHVLVARALDIDLQVVYFFLFVPMLAALVMMPISIGGIGVRESMGAVLFGQVGVAPAPASAMQLLAFLVAVAASLVGGVIFLARRRPPATS